MGTRVQNNLPSNCSLSKSLCVLKVLPPVNVAFTVLKMFIIEAESRAFSEGSWRECSQDTVGCEAQLFVWFEARYQCFAMNFNWFRLQFIFSLSLLRRDLFSVGQNISVFFIVTYRTLSSFGVNEPKATDVMKLCRFLPLELLFLLPDMQNTKGLPTVECLQNQALQNKLVTSLSKQIAIKQEICVVLLEFWT